MLGVVERAERRYQRALEEGDEEADEITRGVVRRKPEEADQARRRLNVALDALNAEPDEDEGDVSSRGFGRC